MDKVGVSVQKLARRVSRLALRLAPSVLCRLQAMSVTIIQDRGGFRVQCMYRLETGHRSGNPDCLVLDAEQYHFPVLSAQCGTGVLSRAIGNQHLAGPLVFKLKRGGGAQGLEVEVVYGWNPGSHPLTVLLPHSLYTPWPPESETDQPSTQLPIPAILVSPGESEDLLVVGGVFSSARTDWPTRGPISLTQGVLLPRAHAVPSREPRYPRPVLLSAMLARNLTPSIGEGLVQESLDALETYQNWLGIPSIARVALICPGETGERIERSSPAIWAVQPPRFTRIGHELLGLRLAGLVWGGGIQFCGDHSARLEASLKHAACLLWIRKGFPRLVDSIRDGLNRLTHQSTLERLTRLGRGRSRVARFAELALILDEDFAAGGPIAKTVQAFSNSGWGTRLPTRIARSLLVGAGVPLSLLW
jgi:hypothetical protein